MEAMVVCFRRKTVQSSKLSKPLRVKRRKETVLTRVQVGCCSLFVVQNWRWMLIYQRKMDIKRINMANYIHWVRNSSAGKKKREIKSNMASDCKRMNINTEWIETKQNRKVRLKSLWANWAPLAYLPTDKICMKFTFIYINIHEVLFYDTVVSSTSPSVQGGQGHKC